LVCAQLELEPGPAEHVWLIPRRNSKTQTIDCSLLLGYKGMKALAERHPAISSVRTGTVCANDEFEHVAQPPSIRHVPHHQDRGDAVLWYAVAERADGAQPHIAVLDRNAVEDRRKHAQSRNNGPWVTHFDQMARKSAIRALWSELPSSLDMQRALVHDDAVVTPAQMISRLDDPPQLRASVDVETGEVLEDGGRERRPIEDPPPAPQPVPISSSGTVGTQAADRSRPATPSPARKAAQRRSRQRPPDEASSESSGLAEEEQAAEIDEASPPGEEVDVREATPGDVNEPETVDEESPSDTTEHARIFEELLGLLRRRFTGANTPARTAWIYSQLDILGVPHATPSGALSVEQLIVIRDAAVAEVERHEAAGEW